MSKRFQVTIADDLYEVLEHWAAVQGRPIANLAGYLVEQALNEAVRTGQTPSKEELASKQALVFLQKLLGGQEISNRELLLLAQNAKLNPIQLTDLLESREQPDKSRK